MEPVFELHVRAADIDAAPETLLMVCSGNAAAVNLAGCIWYAQGYDNTSARIVPAVMKMDVACVA